MDGKCSIKTFEFSPCLSNVRAYNLTLTEMGKTLSTLCALETSIDLRSTHVFYKDSFFIEGNILAGYANRIRCLQ